MFNATATVSGVTTDALFETPQEAWEFVNAAHQAAWDASHTDGKQNADEWLKWASVDDIILDTPQTTTSWEATSTEIPVKYIVTEVTQAPATA